MRHTRLLLAIAVSLWPTIGACGQPASAMSPTLRSHLQGEQFSLVTSIRGLPLDVRNQLQTLWSSSTLDIAEPGAQFQKAGTPVNRQLPARGLIAAGCSNDFHCLVYYERGGSNAPAWFAMLFKWTPDVTQFEWGGTAPGGLMTIDAVRKAILSGAIKGHTGPW